MTNKTHKPFQAGDTFTFTDNTGKTRTAQADMFLGRQMAFFTTDAGNPLSGWMLAKDAKPTNPCTCWHCQNQ